MLRAQARRESDAQVGFAARGHGDLALWAGAEDLLKLSDLEPLAQSAEVVERLASEFADRLWILQPPEILAVPVFGVGGQHEFDVAHLRQFGQQRRPRFGRGGVRAVGGGHDGLRGRLIERLGGVQQQALVGGEDRSIPRGVGRQDFEAAGLPPEDALEGRLGRETRRFGVDDLAVLNPDPPLGDSVADLQEDRALRKALELDEVDEALALDAAEAALGFAFEQRLDRFHEESDLLIGFRLDPILIDAHGVGPRAELFLADRGEHHQAELGILARRDSQHLQAVHFWHVQIADEQGVDLRLEHRERARAGVGRAHVGHARQVVAQHFPIQIQEILVIIQEQDFRLSAHAMKRLRLVSSGGRSA